MEKRFGGALMACNVFRFCTGLRGLGCLMVLLVIGMVGVSYYAMVVANFGPLLFLGGFHTLYALAVLLAFHALLVMLLWSYFYCVLTDPGSVPPNWRPLDLMDEERGDAEQLVQSALVDQGLAPDRLNGQNPSLNQRIRFCRKCNIFKPPRCHHCSVCGKCVLKMDHHCIWVVNCVGALNYKSFLLFLFYTLLESTLVTLSLLPYFLAFFSDDEITGTPTSIITSFITFVMNLAFALSLFGFLIMHLYLVAANTTTIEAYEKKTTSNWCYDLGRKKNFEQVFGVNKRYWLVPGYSEEDLRQVPALCSFEYPIRPELQLLQQS